MAEPKELANKARTTLAEALQALQSTADLPDAVQAIAEPIATTMGILHRIERSGQHDADAATQALNTTRDTLDALQNVGLTHPAIDAAMEAVAGSLSKLYALAKALPGGPTRRSDAPVAMGTGAMGTSQPAGGPNATVPMADAPPIDKSTLVMADDHAGGTPDPVPPPRPKSMPPGPPPPRTKSAPPPRVPGSVPPPPPPRSSSVPPPPQAQVAPTQAATFVPQAYPPPQQGYPQQAHPQQAYPQQAYPQQAYPQQAYPQQGYPQQAYPQQAYPQQAYPQQAYPQPANPQPAYPQAYQAPVLPEAPVEPAPLSTQKERVPGSTDAPMPPADASSVDVELAAHSGSNFYKGLSGNDVIEHGGIFVATYNVPKIGAAVALRMLLPGDLELEADVIVQWVREVGLGDGDGVPGFGARFTRISPEGRELVYRFVKNREPIFYDDM